MHVDPIIIDVVGEKFVIRIKLEMEDPMERSLFFLLPFERAVDAWDGVTIEHLNTIDYSFHHVGTPNDEDLQYLANWVTRIGAIDIGETVVEIILALTLIHRSKCALHVIPIIRLKNGNDE